MLSHVSTCANCRDALDQAQQADARLLDALDRELETLPERDTPFDGRPSRARHRLATAALGAGALVVAFALLAGLMLVGRIVSPPEDPRPLFAGDDRPLESLNGWLLQVSPVGYLEAVNLATGDKRGLDSGDAESGFSPLYRVSRTRIATWRPSDGQRDDSLAIGPIGGQVDFRLTWNRQLVYWYPSGWLNDDTLLIVKSPERVPGETEQQYIERLTRESRLVAFDAVNGVERVLMTGNVAAAFPSPDGTMLAIVQPVDRRWPGATLELRPFDGQVVGEPVIRIEHRLLANGLWLADSSRFITSIVTDDTIEMRESALLGARPSDWFERVALQSIARDGARMTLATARMPETIAPVAASPDGRSIVYQVLAQRSGSSFAGVPSFDWTCYRLSSSGGQPELLTSGRSPERIFNPAWSPNGATLMLPVARAFPLSTDGAIDQPVNPNATTLLVYSSAWRPGEEPRAIYSSGRDLYGWLRPESLEPRSSTSSGDSRTLAAVSPLDEGQNELDFDEGSVAAANGSYIVARVRGDRTLVIWDVASGRRRRLAEETTDLSWFNRWQSTIGVAPDPNRSGGSRIILNAADISSSAAYLDYRVFDPAGLGQSLDRRYARPLVSPSGTAVSFFVVDRRAGVVSLWLDDVAGPATVVSTWQLPEDRAIDPPIVAIWTRSDTLLFAQPGDWSDGMPRTAILSRVVVSSSGEPLVDELVRLDPVHGARGVTLVELSLSPDATELAYRLRHYAEASKDSPADDTIHVAGVDDLGRAIELQRGGVGDGLAWVADGDGVIAGIRGRIALYAPDGRDLEYLSPRSARASNPLLVGGRIWFEAVEDRGERVWQVQLN